MNFINNELRDMIGELNESKGWHDEPRSIAQHCILLHSEVSEIVEDYRSNKAIDEVWYEYKNENGEIVTSDSKYSFQSFIDGSIRYEHEKRLTGKPCGIPSELADVVIRALDMAYEYDYSLSIDELRKSNSVSFEEIISNIHYFISMMFYYNDLSYLDLVISTCFMISNEKGINLEQQIKDKIEYNKTRPIKHGGKRL